MERASFARSGWGGATIVAGHLFASSDLRDDREPSRPPRPACRQDFRDKQAEMRLSNSRECTRFQLLFDDVTVLDVHDL